MFRYIRQLSLRHTAVLSLTSLLLISLHVQAADPADLNAVPASIFRHSYVASISHHHQPYDVDHTIFNPIFVNYILALSYSHDHLNATDIKSAVSRWNNIAQSKKTMIQFKPEHFKRFAALSSNNRTDCNIARACTIEKHDLRILFRWLRWHESLLLGDTSNEEMTRAQLISLNPQHSKALHKVLFSLSRNSVGRLLLKNSMKSHVHIQIKSLNGMYGYYDARESEIAIDPSVIENEFNIRYLAHELVHVLNHDNTNSIMEEVMAELIGLHVQNAITGIGIHEHPYNVFVSRLLHPQYGKLMINNHIESYLQNAGMKYAYQ